MPRLALLVLAAATALPFQATSALRPGDETCVVGPSNDCSLSKTKPSAVGVSTIVYPGGKTRCAFDTWSSPNSSYKTNSTYFFQVFPAKKPSPSKLLLYLEGGGGCWDATSCSFSFICASGFETFYANVRTLSEGIMNRTDPTNLFNDWNIVTVPYCTGDSHIGSTVLDGADPAASASFQQPACLNQNKSVHMNGFVNAETVFDWAAKNFPDVEQLVLTGSSAGAIGVQFFAKRIADKWSVQDKKIKYSVLVDSYMDVFPDTAPIGSLLKYQGSCSLPFGLPESAIESCNTGKGNTTEFVEPTIEATTFADWFYAYSTGDQTQRLYYELLRQGIFAYPFKTMISPADFHQKQLQIFDSYKGATPKLVVCRGE